MGCSNSKEDVKHEPHPHHDHVGAKAGDSQAVVPRSIHTNPAAAAAVIKPEETPAVVDDMESSLPHNENSNSNIHSTSENRKEDPSAPQPADLDNIHNNNNKQEVGDTNALSTESPSSSASGRVPLVVEPEHKVVVSSTMGKDDGHDNNKNNKNTHQQQQAVEAVAVDKKVSARKTPSPEKIETITAVASSPTRSSPMAIHRSKDTSTDNSNTNRKSTPPILATNAPLTTTQAPQVEKAAPREEAIVGRPASHAPTTNNNNTSNNNNNKNSSPPRQTYLAQRHADPVGARRSAASSPTTTRRTDTRVTTTTNTTMTSHPTTTTTTTTAAAATKSAHYPTRTAAHTTGSPLHGKATATTGGGNSYATAMTRANHAQARAPRAAALNKPLAVNTSQADENRNIPKTLNSASTTNSPLTPPATTTSAAYSPPPPRSAETRCSIINAKPKNNMSNNSTNSNNNNNNLSTPLTTGTPHRSSPPLTPLRVSFPVSLNRSPLTEPVSGCAIDAADRDIVLHQDMMPPTVADKRASAAVPARDATNRLALNSSSSGGAAVAKAEAKKMTSNNTNNNSNTIAVPNHDDVLAANSIMTPFSNPHMSSDADAFVAANTPVNIKKGDSNNAIVSNQSGTTRPSELKPHSKAGAATASATPAVATVATIAADTTGSSEVDSNRSSSASRNNTNTTTNNNNIVANNNNSNKKSTSTNLNSNAVALAFSVGNASFNNDANSNNNNNNTNANTINITEDGGGKLSIVDGNNKPVNLLMPHMGSISTRLSGGGRPSRGDFNDNDAAPEWHVLRRPAFVGSSAWHLLQQVRLVLQMKDVSAI